MTELQHACAHTRAQACARACVRSRVRACAAAGLLSVFLGACAHDPYVTGDSRGLFDTSKGMYGGNEFDARSPEGKVDYAGEASAKPPAKAAAPTPEAATAAAAVPVTAPATSVAPAPAIAPAMSPMPALAAAAPAAPAAAAPMILARSETPVAAAGSSDMPAVKRIAIDANAFAAVFGAASAPVKPTAEQLMQLDSLSLVAGDALRPQLQQKILACRRAGDACRLAGQ